MHFDHAESLSEGCIKICSLWLPLGSEVKGQDEGERFLYLTSHASVSFFK